VTILELHDPRLTTTPIARGHGARQPHVQATATLASVRWDAIRRSVRAGRRDAVGR